MLRIFNDYAAADRVWQDRTDQNSVPPQILRAVAAYGERMGHSMQAAEASRTAQATGKGDFGTFPRDILPVEGMPELRDVDTKWELCFRMLDYTTQRVEGITTPVVSGGAYFGQIIDQERIEVGRITGSESSVLFQLYGGGIDMSRTLLDDGKWIDVEDAIRSVWFEYADVRATYGYALINGASPDSVAWQGASSDPNWYRDQQSIAEAVRLIIVDSENRAAHTFRASAASTYLLLYPLTMAARYARALSPALAIDSTSTTLQYNVIPVPTNKITAPTVILPGQTWKFADRKRLEVIQEKPVMTYTQFMGGYSRWVGVIGDIDQAKELAIA